MQAGEIIVVQLQAGPRLARLVELASGRVRIAIGRNREARLPSSRVLLETGLSAASFEAVETLNRQAVAVADEVDLEEVWDVVCDEGQPLTLTDIGELYWGEEPSPQRAAGLVLNLWRDDLRFVRDGDYYVPKSRDTVAETIERRERAAQRAADTSALAAAVRSGKLPDALSRNQSEILDQVRGLAVHGEDYKGVNQVRRFLEAAGAGSRNPQRAAFDTLVGLGLLDADAHLALERAEISAEFPQEALEEAESVEPARLLSAPDRLDLTELLTLSIDDEDTRDRDDALSIERAADGSYRVGVHITDVGALIAQGSALDSEADRRISSLYLPETTIHMLPPALSADKGSLSAGERRAAVSVVIEMSEEGEVTGRQVTPSIIQNRHALSYTEADAAIFDDSHPLHSPLAALHGLAVTLRERRESRGALSIERDELSVKVDERGGIEVSTLPRSAPARNLVQEYMVLCNCLLAEYCRDNDLPAPFRSQVVPDVSDITARVAEGALRWYMMARRLSAATVSTKPGAHGGLGVDAYTQATSPLRRYADLVVQRQISHHLRTGETLYDADAVTSIAHRADVQTRQMSRIENQRRQHFFLKWLDERRGTVEDEGGESVHAATVLENPHNRAANVELIDWPFRSRAALPNSISAGEIVNLRLHGVDLWRRTAQFTLAQPLLS